MVGSFGDTLEEWKDWVRPDFDVYSADPVSLKMISRGGGVVGYDPGREDNMETHLVVLGS